jgi:hypothetical protein
MSGDDRLNRTQKPARSKISFTAVLLALFAAVMFSHFDASMPMQLLAP